MADARSKPQWDIAPVPSVEPSPGSASSAPASVGYLAALAMTVVATALAVSVELGVAIPNLSLIFVVPVVIAAVNFGLGPSLCSALLGALAYNFFLTEPRFSLAVDDPRNIWAIALLFVVGFIVSGVAYTSGLRAAEAARLRRKATVLQNYSRDIVTTGSAEKLASITSEALARLFQVPAVVMLVAGGRVIAAKRAGGGAEPQDAELEAALSSLATGAVVRAGVYPALNSRFDFWPVAGAAGKSAVIGLAFDPDERPSTPETFVDVVKSILALSLGRDHSRDSGPIG